MTSEAKQIAERIQVKLQDAGTLDVSVLNSHIEAQKDKVIYKELETIRGPLKTRIEEEFFGFGPIRPLIDDPAVTEIVINDLSSIWFETNGVFQRLDDHFLTETTYQNFIQRLSRLLQVQTTLDKPFVCKDFENLRVHIAGSSVTEGSTTVTIRKHRNSSWTLEDLMAFGWASQSSAESIRKLVASRKNILVVGPTGSGKTSVLNAIINIAQENERFVILEDTRELKLPNNCSTKILTREDSQGVLTEITLSELLKNALRMRPDRIVVGEIRGSEAKDLLLALSTGHSGSMGTLHAGDAQEALLRLEMLVQLGAPQWSLDSIRKLIYLSVHYLIVVGFDTNRHRKLKGIYRIAGLESFGMTLDPLESGDL